MELDAGPGLAQGRPFLHRLLHAILAEYALSRLKHRLDFGGGEGFRHADQRDILGPAAGIARGAGDRLTDLFEPFRRGCGIFHALMQCFHLPFTQERRI